MRGLEEVSAAAGVLHRGELRPEMGICVHGTGTGVKGPYVGTGPDLEERKPGLGNVDTWLWKRGRSHFSWGA